jgi:DNA primase
MLEALDLENVTQTTEDEINFSCPFPGHAHGDSSPSAYMNVDHTAWMCQGCKRSGNAVTFLAQYANITVMEAIRFLRERYGGLAPDPDSYSIADELERFWEKANDMDIIPEDVCLGESFADEFRTDWEAAAAAKDRPGWANYILDRGFSVETLTICDIGYSEHYDRITIPVHDQDGFLCGFKGRAWRDEQKPKYLVLSTDGKTEWLRYQVSRNVFGLDAVDEHEKTLVIVEGELNAIALWQMGISNAVGVNGSNFSERQSQIIRSRAEKVIVYFDTDTAGAIGTNLVCDRLRDHLPVFVTEDHEGDAADAIDPREDKKHITPDSVRELLNNAVSETRIRLMAAIED